MSLSGADMFKSFLITFRTAQAIIDYEAISPIDTHSGKTLDGIVVYFKNGDKLVYFPKDQGDSNETNKEVERADHQALSSGKDNQGDL